MQFELSLVRSLNFLDDQTRSFAKCISTFWYTAYVGFQIIKLKWYWLISKKMHFKQANLRVTRMQIITALF